METKLGDDTSHLLSDAKIAEAYLALHVGQCKRCSYELHGSKGGVCPECGLAVKLQVVDRLRLPWLRYASAFMLLVIGSQQILATLPLLSVGLPLGVVTALTGVGALAWLVWEAACALRRRPTSDIATIAVAVMVCTFSGLANTCLLVFMMR